MNIDMRADEFMVINRVLISQDMGHMGMVVIVTTTGNNEGSNHVVMITYEVLMEPIAKF